MNERSQLSLRHAFIMLPLLLSANLQAKVKLPSVFGDNMVFQQKTEAAVWGKTDPGKTVELVPGWNKKTYTGKADEKGNWKITMPTPSHGGPYTLQISDGEPLTLNNVLVGEVWVCSGQSNMEMPLAGWGRINNYQQEIDAASYPHIRLLQVEHQTSMTPQEDAQVWEGGWQACSPASIANFSSVAYFFARDIYKKKGVPIGLIHTSWGGTIAEAWTSGGALKKMADFRDMVVQMENAPQNPNDKPFKQQMEEWESSVKTRDAGFEGGSAIWAASVFDAAAWKKMTIPGFWERSALPNFDGVVWFRKKISIPASWAGKELKINLGVIDDDDITYFNGKEIGATQGYNKPRVYTVPAAAVKGGEAVITVRVFDFAGEGGFSSDKNTVALIGDNGQRISLDGDWQFKEGFNLKDVPAMPVSNEGPNRPTVLYNAMIHPFIQFAIRGAIWYQGESNAGRAYQYRELFPLMISDWRDKWGRGDFPFYFVQLANFMKVNDQPEATGWAALREAQLQTLSLPNTGMAVSIDIGDGEDIHPKNKQDVGGRLALIALANTYGEKTAYSGPLLKSSEAKGKEMVLRFTHAEGGLRTRDGKPLAGFAVAGEDQKFYWADAQIRGNQIVVSSPQVAKPVAVRYAWANNPVCNLVNGAGLPASPFRTDSWFDPAYGQR
ncbi:sialate O-acetylesterase [Arcticibacter sp.]|uniref:sialate O-acetylesterase n=1 Tax=Arcticibacter sp. TaxID=1872630 RepID=UPI00388FEFFD